MKTKEPRVTQDGLSREEKIKRIYDVVRPTWFWNTDNESWHTFYDIKYVMIWDVLDYLDMKDWRNFQWWIKFNKPIKIMSFWETKREPIEDQSDYLIDYVYSLLEATTDHVSS